MPRVAGRGYFDDGFRRFDVDCQHGDFYTPDRVKKCVVFFVDWVPTERGEKERLGLNLYVGGGGRLTPPKVLSKSGEARVENPVCLICFGDSVDDNAVGVET